MAQRWPAPKTKLKLSQNEFDDAVKTNIEDFDMSPDEAVKSAVDEFKLQGYDLSCVVQTTAGGSTVEKHPVAVATTAVTSAGDDSQAAAAAFAQLQSALDTAVAEGADATQQACAVGVSAGSLAAVLGALRALHASQPGRTDTAVLQAGLGAARSLMAPSLDIRDSFDDLGGPALVHTLHTTHPGDIDLQAELARCAECACFREEQNKEALMETGYVVSLLCRLAEHARIPGVSKGEPGAPPSTAATLPADGSPAAATVSEPFVAAACGVLRAVCTADDDRPPCSKAFANARLLARQHQALRVVLGVLRALRRDPDATPTLAAAMTTVRQLAANEEICKDFSDEGGVTTCLDLTSALAGRSKDAVRCGLGALRQLTHSDTNKQVLAEHHAAAVLMRVTAQYPEDPEVLEPALGVVANMTLRQPDIVTQCEEEGVIDWVIGALQDLPNSALVQRQAAILTRNMVVRNPEMRPLYLAKGVEELLRAAKKRHPKDCTDVGSAALRDLGLDNYNA